MNTFCTTMFAWVRIAPLGAPVVPDVYMIRQSSGSGATPGSASAGAAASASNAISPASAPPTVTARQPVTSRMPGRTRSRPLV